MILKRYRSEILLVIAVMKHQPTVSLGRMEVTFDDLYPDYGDI